MTRLPPSTALHDAARAAAASGALPPLHELAPGPLERAASGFVPTPSVQHLADRAIAYLRAGLPVHFRGPAGTGKTSLSLFIARQIGRPVSLICGDDSYTSRQLVGSESGQRQSRTVDRYVARVVKVETETSPVWVDQILTTACVEGHTLVYDEFTRSRPETNTVLLTALEERVLILPSAARASDPIVAVHPQFRAIFTSNPAEYVGVHDSQDALLDRMVTIDLDEVEPETEVAIVAARSGLGVAPAARIVALVRAVRASGLCAQTPSLRAGLMIARIAASLCVEVSRHDPVFVQACRDVLSAKLRADAAGHRVLEQLIAELCDPPAPAAAAGSMAGPAPVAAPSAGEASTRHRQPELSLP